MCGKSKNKTLANSPNDRTNNYKQSNQGSKNVRFCPGDQSTKSATTPAQKAKPTKPILRSSPKMTTDDQQSVSMIIEDTDSQVDTKTDYAYDHSSDQEAIMDILCPILNSDSDEDDTFLGLND